MKSSKLSWHMAKKESKEMSMTGWKGGESEGERHKMGGNKYAMRMMPLGMGFHPARSIKGHS